MSAKLRVGINGFGRIGRQVVRAAKERGANLDIVAINDLTDTKTLAHLFTYDSVHGRFEGTVSHDDESITINGDKIKVLKEKDPALLPWKDLKVDVVLESTGRFTKADDAKKHIAGGAKKVIISAPATGEDITLVLGVNGDKYDAAKHTIISNASCTTNCVAPMVKVVRDTFGMKHASMVTIHSYTNDQNILDLPHKDLRRARAAALSMIPTSTGAAKATSLVIPEVKGKIDGTSIRVPTPDVSITELTVEVEKGTTIAEVNAAFKAAAEGALKGIVGYSEEELVSVDYIGNPHSVVLDAKCTNVIDGTLVKVSGWYDNEWGYSSRCVDLLEMVGKSL
ncbi:type I glyceraldehyde-3-phosphate dehydrogenase [Pseudogemmatithrix spongiicola]|uniref:Type I glyceraldehyde-3-phosphate dehydrogenase n=1 Tax=Pseudogemmatithrix spongiicola TaxID=3062599 RepID=A0AA49JUG7_9BACT|nr:type I glyceraldehyde-3-phosphate dehydrogenase [Gemmatimonadaceae bacterium 'strain 138']WKW15155.1 type I glyceraldehyde-3-phosphate dehydrogenase [Gemmatimonadaceae bacterium 'strain 318']